jgi:hypothetical protein
MIGIDLKLLNAVHAIDGWCRRNDLAYDIVCDERDIQAMKILKASKQDIDELEEYVIPFLEKNNLAMDVRKVRGGTVMVLSLKSITEAELDYIMNRINDRLFRKNSRFQASADKIAAALKESDIRRSNYRKFERDLQESLDGIATETGAQPGELFKKFGQAMWALGNEIGVGPLHEVLKKKGINWKKSKDGQSIIFYVTNAETEAPQPIARISAQSLEKPHDFQQQLINVLDFARGEAPGTFKQRQEVMRDQEKAVREIAQMSIGDEEDEISQQMTSAKAAFSAATPKA